MHRLWTLLTARLRGWRLPLAVVLVVFPSSWLAMWLAEPADNEITAPANYWWWFLVTSSTVGYGDFYPRTGLGHLVGAYVILGGVVTLTILFTQLAAYLQAVRGRRMKGLVRLDLSGHTVILGYHPGRTERMVDELCAEGDISLVLVGWDEVGEDPMPERAEVRFVRGDPTGEAVLARAAVPAAATVLVDGRDDNETLAIALAVDHTNPRVHTVVALHDMRRREQFGYLNPGIQCVQWHLPNLITEEALDPGITQVYAELMTSEGAGNTYSVRLPDELAGRSFGDCQTRFGQRWSAILIAVHDGARLAVSPAWDSPVAAGSTLYYLAERRIQA